MESGVFTPELLAPAGNMACLDAALAAGCDAVYAGLDRFGARAYAGNFSPDEFLLAIDRMHLFGKKIYLTLNTLIKPEEFKEIYDFVKPFYEAGLDGVIVQDIGIISLLRGEFAEMEVHASTQMSVSSVYGARLLMEHGVSRIVTSRELSLNEIREIKTETGAELECFIHGAMCYSYSGLCLMSSFLGGRSGNRGRCAGPCRQPYSSGKMKDRYLLSMKDMCVIDILDELIEAGIDSFKIEGRMKSPAYVYGVTEIYRRNIDRILDNPDRPYSPEETDRKRLTDLYSRGGISEGYYHRQNGQAMITMEKGAYIREDKDGTEIKRRKLPLKAELYVYSGEPVRLTVSLSDRLSGNQSAQSASSLLAGETAPGPGRLSEKQILQSASYLPASENDQDPKCGASQADTMITLEGAAAEKASNRPMSKEDYIKQLNKTGDTDFSFDSILVDTDGQSFIRVSALNELRRSALEMMKERLTDGYKRSM